MHCAMNTVHAMSCQQKQNNNNIRLTALCLELPGWAGTRKVKPIWIYWSEWHWYQLGHMQACTSPQTDNHASTPSLSFLQAGCPSCRPTNSIKALKVTRTEMGDVKGWLGDGLQWESITAQLHTSYTLEMTCYLPVPPVCPVPPVAPTSPRSPTWPTWPVGPGWPVGPESPGNPGAPVAPGLPIGPPGPDWPVKPSGPVKPCSPGCPCWPLGPVKPGWPTSPVWPAFPLTPCSPCWPSIPTMRHINVQYLLTNVST